MYGMIDKKFNPDFRITVQDDGWMTIYDDTGFIEVAPDEVKLLRNFLTPLAEVPPDALREAIAKLARKEHFSDQGENAMFPWEALGDHYKTRWLALADRILSLLPAEGPRSAREPEQKDQPCPFCKRPLESRGGYYTCPNKACSFPIGYAVAGVKGTGLWGWTMDKNQDGVGRKRIQWKMLHPVTGIVLIEYPHDMSPQQLVDAICIVIGDPTPREPISLSLLAEGPATKEPEQSQLSGNPGQLGAEGMGEPLDLDVIFETLHGGAALLQVRNAGGEIVLEEIAPAEHHAEIQEIARRLRRPEGQGEARP